MHRKHGCLRFSPFYKEGNLYKYGPINQRAGIKLQREKLRRK